MISLSRLFSCCCLFLVLPGASMAQSSEFSISAGTGIAGLKYATAGGSSKLKIGYQATAGYTFFFHRNWGISTGIELGYYQTNAGLSPENVYKSNMVDSEGEGFELRAQARGYEEKQRLYTLNIPLLAHFQAPAGKGTQWYTKVGIKLSIPWKATFHAHADEIQASGYYPNMDLLITELPAHGFGKQANWKGEGNYSLNPSASLAAETGIRFRMAPGRYLYAGGYIDYGLNNVKKDEAEPSLFSYNLTSINNSKATGIFSLPNTTGNVRLVAYGIRLGFAFSAGR